jgi:hypothetical protein
VSFIHGAPPNSFSNREEREGRKEEKVTEERILAFLACLAVVIDKINRPSRMRWAIGLTFIASSTGKASPNDPRVIIIIVIVVVGEADLTLHGDGIIAQSLKTFSPADSAPLGCNTRWQSSVHVIGEICGGRYLRIASAI